MNAFQSLPFRHKVLIPQRPAHLVPRRRLRDLLGAIEERQLITLVAPAGYGKTSLLTDFATTETTLPVCWYTIDRFDSDFFVFTRYLVAAVEQQFPAAFPQTTALLNSSGAKTFEALATMLLRECYAVSAFILILDDWHLVDHVTDIGELIMQLLTRCMNCHIMLASRAQTSLPDLMLLTARRQVSGLDEERLRFTAEEVVAVLEAEYAIQVPIERAVALTDQTNGWITGVLLAMQTCGANKISDAMPSLAGRHIYRFLAEQVFDQQPPAIQQFLLDAALLEELTVERCVALLERPDAGSMLDYVQRQHLFIGEIEAGVWRFHPLFREFLLDHYRLWWRAAYYERTQKIIEAYIAEAQWDVAFELCVAADAMALAQRVVRQGGELLYVNGRLSTLNRWFALLPLDDLDDLLLCLKARVTLTQGRTSEAQVLADLAQARMTPEHACPVLCLQSQLAWVAGAYERAIDLAQRALEVATTPEQQANALHALARAHQRYDETSLAIHELQEALVIQRQRGDLYALALLHTDLGMRYEHGGSLQLAEEYYRLADAYWATIGNVGQRAVSLNNIGVIQHRLGNYQEAQRTLTTALKHAHDAAAWLYQVVILASLGDLYTDLQLFDQAHVAYETARQSGRGGAQMLAYLALADVRLNLRLRQYARALTTLNQIDPTTYKQQWAFAQLLRAEAELGMNNIAGTAALLQEIDAALDATDNWIDRARCAILHARLVAITDQQHSGAVIPWLEHAATAAAQLGHDSFLIAELVPLAAVLRRVAVTWPLAADWLARQQQLRIQAQSLDALHDRPVLAVRTFGTDEIAVDGQVVKIGWLQARETLYYLLEHPEGATADVLCEALWPDKSPASSRELLKTAIYRLRSALPVDTIMLHRRQIYQLNTSAVRVEYDAAQFLAMTNASTVALDTLLEAIELYHGPYLPWSEAHWAGIARATFEQRYSAALHTIALQYETHQMYAEALRFYRQIVGSDTLNEQAHAGIMRCQVALGNRAAAIEQYRSLRRQLDDELGLDPEPASEVELIYARIVHAS